MYTGITAVVLFVGYKLFKKLSANMVDDLQPKGISTKPSNQFTLKNITIPQSVIDEGLAKAKDRSQAKMAKYEALWKKSGSTLSFKEWYIENAD